MDLTVDWQSVAAPRLIQRPDSAGRRPSARDSSTTYRENTEAFVLAVWEARRATDHTRDQ